jgi:hypothetical protein
MCDESFRLSWFDYAHVKAVFDEKEAMTAIRKFVGAKQVMLYKDFNGLMRVMDEAGRLLAWQSEDGSIHLIQEPPVLEDLEAPDKYA